MECVKNKRQIDCFVKKWEDSSSWNSCFKYHGISFVYNKIILKQILFSLHEIFVSLHTEVYLPQY